MRYLNRYIRLAALTVLAIGVGFPAEAQAQTIGNPSDVTVTPTGLTAAGAGQYPTNADTVNLSVDLQTDFLPGTLVVNNNSRSKSQNVTAFPATVNSVALDKEQVNVISVHYSAKKDNKTYTVVSSPIHIHHDSNGPHLQEATLAAQPSAAGVGQIVTLRFSDDDIKESTLGNGFAVFRDAVPANESGGTAPRSFRRDGRFVHLEFQSLPAGEYILVVKNTVTDELGNVRTTSRTRFSVSGQRQFGQHVAFPPFTPPKKQAIPEEGFNPGDQVVTRVARLFYFRDAHRVAQIVNRNIRSYNRAAVTLAERKAETSRDNADDATDDRRRNERAAVRSAEATRHAENQLAQARQDLEQVRELELNKARKEAEITKLQAAMEPAVTAMGAAAEAKKVADAAKDQAKSSRLNADRLRREAVRAEASFRAIEPTTGEREAYLVAVSAEHTKLQNEQSDKEAELEQVRGEGGDVAKAEADVTKARKAVAIVKRKLSKAEAAVAEITTREAAWNAATEKYAKADDLAFEHEEESAKAAIDYQVKAERAAQTAAEIGYERLLAQQKQLQSEVELAEQINNNTITAADVAAMEQSVANLRQAELAQQEAWDQAEAKESRARARQFRDEVSAATTDPDTYVAGDITSVDPVTQVSISVIGEGLIQLRGPIKGVNKIRTMINQIDMPVGQIKIGVFTLQVNGEKGDEMEKVVGDAEGYIDLSRFLVNQSLNLLRRCIQAEAARVAEECAIEGHYQVDRDRRYLYRFFGRDFIDELYEMNSEFMFTENKLLSLHAMDTVSLNRALFILALAKNDVRENIVCNFLQAAKTELADAEYDFRRSSELRPHRTQKRFPSWNRVRLPIKDRYHQENVIYEAVHRQANQRYHFRNFSSFFNTGFTSPDTMNPMQREFIRLAQIFKARLVAEIELKQRVVERGLIEDQSNIELKILRSVEEAQEVAVQAVADAYVGLARADQTIQEATARLNALRPNLLNVTTIIKHLQQLSRMGFQTPEKEVKDRANQFAKKLDDFLQLETESWLTSDEIVRVDDAKQRVRLARNELDQSPLDRLTVITRLKNAAQILADVADVYNRRVEAWHEVDRALKPLQGISDFNQDVLDNDELVALDETIGRLKSNFEGSQLAAQLIENFTAIRSAAGAKNRVARARQVLNEIRGELDHRKMLDHLIDEQEEVFIELVEGSRSHIAVIDQYLKRLSIGLEDDFKAQFYDPAFVRVRDAARTRAVNLGQVERTTILTNNRAFAKVDPQATMEFDLPKRQIAVKEAFDAAKALIEDTGALVNDPTFLAAFQMMGGAAAPTMVKNVVPGQSTSADQFRMSMAPDQASTGPGSALQNLVPEPAIYKLETGTGFQIRPVMQPDGDSVIYDFDYMYTTNIREPVRADEKHVGRIKRHFIHTAVQTSNFEIREISRYQVALKVSRTSRGVPLLEDIPVVGAAFRPAPSDESSLQQNIILGQTNVYPTLFDLMGLRWAQQVADLGHLSLLEAEHVARGRSESIRNFVFDHASARVDRFLKINEPEQPPTRRGKHYRPDLYHRQTSPSPYHPGGFHYHKAESDPSNHGYEVKDRRPIEMQEPPYELYRHRPVRMERLPVITGEASAPAPVPSVLHTSIGDR